MKVTGIIAEYNPFHKGHQYQIEKLRERFAPDYIVVAMSGDFLQRGTPAFMDKYSRTQMALFQGADLVFELPAYFATASAETFALGGVLLFHTTGLVDSLAFGAESDDLPRLSALAQLLSEEPNWYRDALLAGLKGGLSFPAARAKALPKYSDLLESPNNILALEYLKSIAAFAPHIAPILIKREGSGYHSTDINAPLASATAIRKSLFSSAVPKELTTALPEASCQIMTDYQKNASFLQEDDFSLLLHHTLLQESPESLLQYADMTTALANRLCQQRNSFLSWSDFCQLCDTRDITYTRVSRALTHLLLNIRRETLTPYTHKSGEISTQSQTACTASSSMGTPLCTGRPAADSLPYLRILGFRESAAPLLRSLKASAKAPLITNPSAAGQQLSPGGLAMLNTDIYASDLYRSVLTAKTGRLYPNEYQRKLLVCR